MNRQDDTQHALGDLCALTGLSPRTVRYYVQIGLVDRPQGETRAARYGAKQLEQLLLIQKWTAAGVSLEGIRELLQGGDAPIPVRAPKPGNIEVRSHILITEGVELVLAPDRAELSPEQVRQMVKGVIELYANITAKNAATNQKETSDDE